MKKKTFTQVALNPVLGLITCTRKHHYYILAIPNLLLFFYRNEDYPTAVTTAGSCEYEVEKCDENVCTLRLDFEEFTLDSWAATASDDSGYICSDTFVVSDVSDLFYLINNIFYVKLYNVMLLYIFFNFLVRYRSSGTNYLRYVYNI